MKIRRKITRLYLGEGIIKHRFARIFNKSIIYQLKYEYPCPRKN